MEPVHKAGFANVSFFSSCSFLRRLQILLALLDCSAYLLLVLVRCAHTRRTDDYPQIEGIQFQLCGEPLDQRAPFGCRLARSARLRLSRRSRRRNSLPGGLVRLCDVYPRYRSRLAISGLLGGFLAARE